MQNIISLNGLKTQTEPGATMRKRIGSTVYEVCVHFSTDAKETMNDKILRLIKNDLHLAHDCTTMSLPQTGRLPEGSSL